MFSFLKGKGSSPSKRIPVLADLNQQPLAEGDLVESLRYGLGTCRVVLTDRGLAYESLQDGRRVTWHRMVDAATDLQKVQKITEEADA